MGWLRDASQGLQEGQQAARATEAGYCRVLLSLCDAVVPMTPAVAESVGDLTRAERFSHAVWAIGT